MDETGGMSLPRRLSIDSTATSEFEVVSRERSVSGSTVEGSSHSDEVSLADISSPPISLRIPALYTETSPDDHESPPNESINPRPTWSIDDADMRSLTSSMAQMSDSCVSDVSMMGKETMGMLEQVFRELALMKGRNTLLERTVEQANEWRDKADRLEEQNRILQKSLRTSKKKVEQFTEEVEGLKKREEKLLLNLKEVDERQARNSTSWRYRMIGLCLIIAIVGLYIDCYAQLLREHRSCEQLKEQLKLMNELVEKLEAEHAAEYKRRLEEISKQMADDMSASIALAHKQREDEHERLIEAYREKMRLHDDLSALRKEKLRGRKKSSTWFR